METEEGSKKRKGIRPGKKDKGKGKEKVDESPEMTEVLVEVRWLMGMVKRLRGGG